MADMKLQRELRKRGFRHYPEMAEKYRHIAEEFPRKFMNIMHFEERSIIAYAIAFDDSGGVWASFGQAFGDLSDLGMAEMFAEDFAAQAAKRLH